MTHQPTPAHATGSVVVQMDGACAGMSLEELSALHLLQTRAPTSWVEVLVSGKEPALRRLAQFPRDKAEFDLAPVKVRRVMACAARRANRKAIEPAVAWLGARKTGRGQPPASHDNLQQDETRRPA